MSQCSTKSVSFNESRFLRRLALGALLAAALGGCGQADSDGTTESSSAKEAASWEGPLPADLTSEEVCGLIEESTVAEIIGVEQIKDVRPGPGRTPQCNWWFKVPDGPTTSVVVAVQRAEGDLRGKAGREAFDYALEINLSAQRGAEAEPIADIGEAAVAVTGGYSDGVVALAPDGRVVMISGDHAGADGRARLAAAALAGLSGRQAATD